MPPSFTPHDPLPVEPTFDAFVRDAGGRVLRDQLGPNPRYQNADYFFPSPDVLIELKSFDKDLPYTLKALERTGALVLSALASGEITQEQIDGLAPFPESYLEKFHLQFRPPLQQVLKKANRQLRDTRHYLPCRGAHSLVFLVNDGLYGIRPEPMCALIEDILGRHFSSIDGYVYITLNQYVSIPASPLANLLWSPKYHPRAPAELPAFVNRLGKQWGDYLEHIIGPFDGRIATDQVDILEGSGNIRRYPPRIAG